MKAKTIKTHSTESFRDRFVKPDKNLAHLLKSGFGKFFIVRVEEFLKLIRLPVPPTRSTTHTFLYIAQGEAVMTIGSNTFRILKDECLIIPAGQVFSFSNPDINKGYLCNFHNDIIIGKFGKNDLLNDFVFLKIWGEHQISLDKETSQNCCSLLKRIYRQYSLNGLQNLDLIQSYFIALLCEINNVYKPLLITSNATPVNLANKFKELVFSNIKDKHLLTDYASLLNVTPNHLNKSVKIATGKSATKWINEALILQAKVLLYQSTWTIKEVAAEIGFYDQSYFSRFFKKQVGVTPLVFRRKIEKS